LASNIILRCKNCRSRLTPPLIALLNIRDYHQVQDEDYFKKGMYYRLVESKKTYFLINTADDTGFNDHPDTSRFSGCCGPSPDGKPNQICRNCKTEIGRLTTECIFPHYIKVDTSLVTVENDEFQFFKIITHPFLTQVDPQKLLEIETIYQYSSKAESFKLLIVAIDHLQTTIPEDIKKIMNS